MAEERVQKILARAGYGSRRASEDLISAGRVRINGEIATLGTKADPRRDTITVDNQLIAKEQAPVYIALNKPQGILSEVSPEETRETVRDLVPIPGHMFIVGRLDLDSEGLILMTNDGELANRLTHPRYGHEKEYRVLVGKRPDDEQFKAWQHGIVLEDGHRTAPADVRLEGISGKNAWLRVILNEGRKRQIREMGKLTGLPVLRIIRVRIGSLLLGELKPGQWRELRPDEVRALRAQSPRRPSVRVFRREPHRAGEGASRSYSPKEGSRQPSRRPQEGSTHSEDAPKRGGPSRRPESPLAPGAPRRPSVSRRPGAPRPGNTSRPENGQRPTHGSRRISRRR